MVQNEGKNTVYKILSLSFSLLIIVVMFFDIINKYSQQNIKIFSIESPILFPFLLGLHLLINFMLELRAEIKNRPTKAENIVEKMGEKAIVENKQGKEILTILIFTAISLIYMYILPIFHFIIATSIYMFLIMFIANNRDNILQRLVKSAIWTAITIPIIYYIFYGIFDVILP